ncbi:MAG: hypothetical protein C0501_13185 [Isosphaera sp.]|nr:hypothetical protein [Isosphaera sp.]
MTALAYLASLVVIAGVVGLFLFPLARRNARRSKALADEIISRAEKRAGDPPPLEPFVPLPLPDFDPPDAELRITIARHPESDGDRLSKIAADVIREASRLEESFGGDGLEYDQAGSVEEPTKLVLRLVPNRVDWETPDRLGEVADELNCRVKKARVAATPPPDDLRHRIDRELHPPLPPEVRDVEVTVGPWSGPANVAAAAVPA